jgi:aminomethyltransferase
MPRSPLHDEHVALGATLVDFAGWEMPVRYSGDVAEHLAVRSAAGLFDISHMGEIAVRGADASAALDFALASSMSRVGLGRAKYTMLCTPEGGVIDDLIVYRRDWDHFLVVANAANTREVVAALEERLAGHRAAVVDESHTVSLIAIQGPRAEDIVAAMCDRGAEDVRAATYYSWCTVVLRGDIHAMCARTGYTGEDGFELFVTAQDAVEVWRLAQEVGGPSGLVPCGLSARDTLRLEAGMPLYGQELGRERSPFAAGLGRVVQFGAGRELLPPGVDGAVALTSEPVARGDFVGRSALEAARDTHEEAVANPATASADARVLVGLVGEGRRSARPGYALFDGDELVGEVTSGAPSPTFGVAIAMAYVHPRVAEPGTVVGADVRGRREPMTVTALPFYQRA